MDVEGASRRQICPRARRTLASNSLSFIKQMSDEALACFGDKNHSAANCCADSKRQPMGCNGCEYNLEPVDMDEDELNGDGANRHERPFVFEYIARKDRAICADNIQKDELLSQGDHDKCKRPGKRKVVFPPSNPKGNQGRCGSKYTHFNKPADVKFGKQFCFRA